ncbi:MAG TPA: LacI family transcriptional regulator [Actinobacteria bacterium]|nr:LacI family transcriptional regulator [Actinomycetota bacterium]
MAARPTIRDVAKAAGVSVTTVSHALNDKGRVDPATRALVVQVVRQLGYRANRHARGLRSGRSGALALLLPVQADVRADEALSLDFYMRLASAAATAAFSQEQALMLLPPRIVQTGLRGLGVDGGIVVDPSPLDPRVSLLTELGLPVVTIERDLGRPDDRWYVASETDANTRQVLDHLAAQGARRIALLVPKTDWGWASETLNAYDSWVREHDAPRLIVSAAMQPGEESAFLATQRLLDGRRPPDAVFVAAARFVRGVLRAAKANGRRVPEELLIAAGVDSIQAREGDPPVTALDLHPERQAEAAVEMLLARLDDGQVEAPRHIPATLRLRASTGAV